MMLGLAIGLLTSPSSPGWGEFAGGLLVALGFLSPPAELSRHWAAAKWGAAGSK